MASIYGPPATCGGEGAETGAGREGGVDRDDQFTRLIEGQPVQLAWTAAGQKHDRVEAKAELIKVGLWWGAWHGCSEQAMPREAGGVQIHRSRLYF
jgi:hypothetical protein